ncbi:hypothetical protein SEVIR_6G004900v4 [Setaria viridis]
MASAGVNMPGGDGNPGAASSSSTTECRLRRRRRLAPPRATVAAGGPSEEKRVRPSSASEEEEGQEGEADAVLKEEEEGGTQQQQLPLSAAGPQPPPSPGAAARAWPVAFGWLSVAGRSREMEDAVSLRPGFCTWIDGSPMHFFGVFDGHGGSHVSTLCRDRMHEFLAEELAAEGAALQKQQQQQQATEGEAGTTTSSQPQVVEDEKEEEEERAWRAALDRTFRRVDALASLACACGRIVRPPCRCLLSCNSDIVGSTAVVAVLVRGCVVVANCGDSRAVLCRGPAGAPPVPLSRDHKVRTYARHASPGQSLVAALTRARCTDIKARGAGPCSGSPSFRWRGGHVSVSAGARGATAGETVVDGGATAGELLARCGAALFSLLFFSSLPGDE